MLRTRGFVTLMLVLLMLIVGSASSAHAAAPASYLVKTVPPRFQMLPPGKGNAPMDRDAVLEFLDAEEDALLELDEAAFESAYLRTWVDTERAEFIVSAVIAMNKPLPPTEFFEDLGDPDPGYKLFKIPGVPNSKGAAGGEGALAVYIKRHHIFVTALLTERPTDPKRLIPIVQGHVKGPLASLPEATDPLSHVVRRLAARHRVASAAAASAVVALVTGWWRHRRRRSLRTAIITFG